MERRRAAPPRATRSVNVQLLRKVRAVLESDAL